MLAFLFFIFKKIVIKNPDASLIWRIRVLFVIYRRVLQTSTHSSFHSQSGQHSARSCSDMWRMDGMPWSVRGESDASVCFGAAFSVSSVVFSFWPTRWSNTAGFGEVQEPSTQLGQWPQRSSGPFTRVIGVRGSVVSCFWTIVIWAVNSGL